MAGAHTTVVIMRTFLLRAILAGLTVSHDSSNSYLTHVLIYSLANVIMLQSFRMGIMALFLRVWVILLCGYNPDL